MHFEPRVESLDQGEVEVSHLKTAVEFDPFEDLRPSYGELLSSRQILGFRENDSRDE
jgi:hypothetical protein